MNKFRFIFLLIFLVSFYHISFSQTLPLPDGVSGTMSFINEIIRNYTDENTILYDVNTVSTNVPVRISIRVHIIKDKEGATGVKEQDVFNSVLVANGYFRNIGIQFFIDTINYVDDYNYSLIAYDKNRIELLTKYAVINKINLFIADTVKIGGMRSFGFTYFPNITDSNYIFLDKKFVAGNSLTTMLGHFMGLLSTHEFRGGSELVSETNCATAGDFICDTYADPDIYGQVVDTCQYTGAMRDREGRYYVPSVANLMANSLDYCKCVFTPLQYKRMYYYYWKYRQYLRF